MANRHMNLDGGETDNHRIGRELYNKDKHYDQDNNQRYGNGREQNRDWDEGNFFHTGPNPRGAQDRNRYNNDNDSYRGGSSHSSYNQGSNAHLNDHYGSRNDSPYRNERSFIDHGDRGTNRYMHDESHSMRRPRTPGGSLQGNHDDVNDYQNDPWREGPGSGSRYKESDYRYGSGSHNWYRENRYTPNNDDDRRENPRHDDRGFMDRVKDTWNDIWHADDDQYDHRDRYDSNSDRLNTRERYDSGAYRDRNFDRGYEGGPRWADESDNGRDDYENSRNIENRYRR